MANQKHLTLDERTAIQKMITDHASFIEIARTLDKDPTTISKEIRTHLVFVRVGYKHVNYNACKHRFTCQKLHVCRICNHDKHRNTCRKCHS